MDYKSTYQSVLRRESQIYSKLKKYGKTVPHLHNDDDLFYRPLESQIVYPGPGEYNPRISEAKDFSAGNWGSVKGVKNTPVPRTQVAVAYVSPTKTAVSSVRKMKSAAAAPSPKPSTDKPIIGPKYFGQDVGNIRLRPAQSMKFLSAEKKSLFDTPSMRNSQHLGPGQFYIKHVDQIQYAESSNVHVPFGSSKGRCRAISPDISSQVERLRREKLKKAFKKIEKSSVGLHMEVAAPPNGSSKAYDPFKWLRDKPGGEARLVEISNRLCERDSNLEGVIKVKKGIRGLRTKK